MKPRLSVRRHTQAGSGSAWREIPIDRGDVGVRVDLVVLRHLAHEPGVSRARIQKWIAGERVFVNGPPAPRAAWRVAEGDRLEVDGRQIRVRARPRAEAAAVDVLFEDAHLMAVNKPAGVVVHPSYRHSSGTLMNALLHRSASWPSGDAPALLTRLDKLTSGVLLVAKRREVVARLQHEMRTERIEKDYLAVVHGRPTPARGTIDLALDRDPWDRRKVTVTDRGGQPSVTRYERIAVSAAAEAGIGEAGEAARSGGARHALLKCRLVTGRMHQIRAHLAARGWPLVGDPVYGLEGHGPSFPRQALHAWRVAFTHPVTGERLEIVAPVPNDLLALIRQLGLDFNE